MTSSTANPLSLEELVCPACDGFGFLETEDEGSIECPECEGDGTVIATALPQDQGQ